MIARWQRRKAAQVEEKNGKIESDFIRLWLRLKAREMRLLMSREQTVLRNLLDLFPKPAAIWDIREDELTFIKCEWPRIFVFAEDKLQRLAVRAPMSSDRRGAVGRGHGPILGCAIGAQNQMFVPRTSENDGGFAPMTNKRPRIFRSWASDAI